MWIDFVKIPGEISGQDGSAWRITLSLYPGNQAIPALAPKLLTSSLPSLPSLIWLQPPVLSFSCKQNSFPTPHPRTFAHALLATWNALPLNLYLAGFVSSLISAEGHFLREDPLTCTSFPCQHHITVFSSLYLYFSEIIFTDLVLVLLPFSTGFHEIRHPVSS